MATGVYNADSGEILFEGHDIGGLPPHRIAQLGISRTFQNLSLFSRMTALENVMVGRDFKGRTGIFSALLRPPRVGHEEADNRGHCMDVMSLFGERLLPRLNQPARELSYANRRRVEIARALVSGPKLILLDEPTAGMNPHETQQVVDLIRLIRDRGHSVMVIEHKMSVVMTVSDRIVVLDHGEKIAEGTPSAIAADPIVIDAYMGGRQRAQAD
jgi:ABC-type branched-subunit amino acid transport system ATPase component